MSVRVAPYVGVTLGQVSSIVGATLIAASWSEDKNRGSALGAGFALIGLGTVLSFLSQRELH